MLNFTQGSSVTSWRSNPVFGIGAHQISLRSTLTHTPFWSKYKRHYWFPSKLASGPEALKTSNLWRNLFCEAVPPSTTATWRMSSLPAQSLSISSYWVCWVVETHRKWILARTRRRIWRLLCRAWKKSFGPVTNIPCVSNWILYLAHHLKINLWWPQGCQNSGRHTGPTRHIVSAIMFVPPFSTPKPGIYWVRGTVEQGEPPSLYPSWPR